MLHDVADVPSESHRREFGPVLRGFVANEHSTENLEFYLATQSKPKGPAARKLYEKYIVKNAPEQINVKGQAQQYFDKIEAQGSWSNPDWEPARTEILKILKSDSGNRFYLSPIYFALF